RGESSVAPKRDNAGRRTRRCQTVVRTLVMSLALKLLSVLLDARRAQARESVLVDGVLPREEFFDRQRVTAAGFLEREETAAHSSDNFGLSPDHPTLGARRRQIRDRQGAAVWPDDVLGPRSKGLSHVSTHALD